MKNQLLTLMVFFSLAGLFAQQLDNRHNEMTCGHAKFYQEYYKEAMDIVQTPLLFDYDVKFYYLDIEVDNSSIYISGETTIMAEVVAAELDTFAVELLNDLTVDVINYNGNPISYSHANDEIFAILPATLSQGDLFSVTIQYHGMPPTGGFFAGVSNSNGWGKDVTWTLSEPFAARSWFPVKQVLEDKADSAWIFLTTDDGNMAGSNGLLTNIATLPNNQLRYEWKTNYPIDFYLISFAVSEYQEYNIYAHPTEMGGDSILIQNFIYDSPGCLEYYQAGIDQTAEFIELYSDLFSLYPFYEEKYGHCLTQLGGGMEHQTMTTLGGFSFGLVAHELGHMWFGDNITCATWSDIWINEGFATYADYLAVQNIQGQAAANAEMNATHNSVMSQPGGSTYIPPEEITYDNVWRIFDGRLSYNKGSAILHMIRFELQDDDLFFQVLHEYTDMYADSVATGLDFMNVLNDVSGMDFTQFFDQWYFGEGYPTYSIEWSQDAAYAYFEINQTVSKPNVTPVFEMLMEYKLFFYDNTDTIIQLYQTDNVNTFMLPITKEIGLIQIDPNNWVLNQNGSITTNIDKPKNAAAFTFGPNPTREKLNLNFINANGEESKITLLNIIGEVVLSQTVTEPNSVLDLRDLTSGTYFIHVTNASYSFNKKFVKID